MCCLCFLNWIGTLFLNKKIISITFQFLVQLAKNHPKSKKVKTYVKVVCVTSTVRQSVQRRLRTKKGLHAGTTLGVVSPTEGGMAKGGKTHDSPWNWCTLARLSLFSHLTWKFSFHRQNSSLTHTHTHTYTHTHGGCMSHLYLSFSLNTVEALPAVK